MEISKTITKYRGAIIAILLIALGVTWRLMPHEPNFAPIGAIALTAGLALGAKRSLIVVLSTMAISDLAIGSYPGMGWTWLGIGLIITLGVAVKRLPLLGRIIVGALGASVTFFVVSNFGTWLSSGMYSHDIAGLIQCYVMALPFLKATLLSDLVFSATLLSIYEVASARLPRRVTRTNLAHSASL